MKKEFKIGIFTVLMILVAWGGIRFLSGIDLFRSNNDYYASYDEVDGIQTASPVFISGVKVGSVSEIMLDTNGGDPKVVLRLTISNQYKIPANSDAKIFNSSIMGPIAVDLTLGDSSEILEYGDSIPTSREVGMMDMATKEIDYLKERIDLLTNELAKTLQSVNALVEANNKSVTNTMANLDGLTATLNTTMSQNQENLTTMMSGAAKLSEKLGESSSDISVSLSNLNKITTELSEANLGSSMDQTLTTLNELLGDVNDGSGNAGKLLRDEALYSNMTSSMANLDSLLFDLRAHPSRYVSISVFGGNEDRKAARAAKKERKNILEAERDAAKAARRE